MYCFISGVMHAALQDSLQPELQAESHTAGHCCLHSFAQVEHERWHASIALSTASSHAPPASQEVVDTSHAAAQDRRRTPSGIHSSRDRVGTTSYSYVSATPWESVAAFRPPPSDASS